MTATAAQPNPTKDPTTKFNRITAPQLEVLLSHQPRTGFISGQGAGKTFIMAFISYLFIKFFPNLIGLIAANTYGQLSKATLLEIKRGWKHFGQTEYHAKSNPNGTYIANSYPPADWPKVHPKFDSPSGIIFWKNGAVVFTASLDNYKALEGQTLGWALLDETKDTRQEAIEHVILGRLRQDGLYVWHNAKERIKGIAKGLKSASNWFPFTSKPMEGDNENRSINPLYIFTSPTKEMWLIDFFALDRFREEIKDSIYKPDDYFVKDFEGKKAIISSTYHNAPNLPKNYIDDRINGMPNELVNFNIYGDPFSKSGAEYITGFNHAKNVSHKARYHQRFPLHLTVDFNTSPYMSGLVCQLIPTTAEENGETWKGRKSWMDLLFIHEYALPHPKATAGHLGEAFLNDFGHLCDPGFFVYGDKTGFNKIPAKNLKSIFHDLLNALDPVLFNDSLRVPTKNPGYKHISAGMMGRRDFTNMLFDGKHPVRILINPVCSNYIRDAEFCREDPNGKLAKPKNKDGVEEMGHHLQAAEYFYCHPKSIGYLAKR